MSKQVVTFGCRLNAFESQVMQTQLDELALKEDIVVFNSCAVTKEAERHLYLFISFDPFCSRADCGNGY